MLQLNAKAVEFLKYQELSILDSSPGKCPGPCVSQVKLLNMSFLALKLLYNPEPGYFERAGNSALQTVWIWKSHDSFRPYRHMTVLQT